MQKKCCGLCCRAAIISWFFFKTQNPRLINESGFKSRAAYDGACTVSNFASPPSKLDNRCYHNVHNRRESRVDSDCVLPFGHQIAGENSPTELASWVAFMLRWRNMKSRLQRRAGAANSVTSAQNWTASGFTNYSLSSWWFTPARTLSISGLKSRVLKLTFLTLKWWWKVV